MFLSDVNKLIKYVQYKKMQWIQFIIIWKVYDATVPASESHKRKYYPWNKVIEYKA